MSEDNRTLWVGNLDEKVTEELVFELFYQTGPIDRLILPTEGEGENKKHKGHAYVVFSHPESVQYASQVLEGTTLFGHPMALKARGLPITYKTSTSASSNNAQSNRGRFDNSSLRTGFNKATTWHGQSDFAPRGRGSFRGRGSGVSSYNQSSNYNSGYSSYNNQGNGNFWMGGQQNTNDNSQIAAYNSGGSLEEKRQRLMQQQNITLEAHRQIQQGVMNMATQMYGMAQQQQQQQQQQQKQQQQQQTQQQQQQGMWVNNGYNTPGATWNMGNGADSSVYQGYSTEQYGAWYAPQQ